MNTHNNIINGLPVLRIWHSFDAEELQNIDGKGTDLFPLPNIKGLQTEQGKVNLPYMDILLRDSRITPQILIYSGELSEQQEKLFEYFLGRCEDNSIPCAWSQVCSKLPPLSGFSFFLMFIIKNMGINCFFIYY